MLLINKRNPCSRLAFWLSAAVISACVLLVPVGNVLSWDVFGYYLYLPLTFHQHDLLMTNDSMVRNVISTYHNTDTFYQAIQLPNGNWVLKYSMGLSVLYAPFYFIGQGMAALFQFPTDGFSKPYQLSILYGSLLYTLTGLYFLRKILCCFFEDKVAAITFLLIVFGTNYFFHVSLHGQGAMSHNMLFTLYSIILWFSIRWHEQQKTKDALVLGACIGLATLTRPSEIISLLIPLLYGVYSKESLGQKWHMLYKHRWQICAAAILIMMMAGCQLIYYKAATGRFYYNSYGTCNPGEGFEFFHPYFAEVLFSFRKGWLIYTPIMIMALAGLFFIPGKKGAGWMPLLFFVLNLYIIASWSCWWYAGSYSSRALIPSYVIMAIPLGYTISRIIRSKTKFIFMPVIAVLVLLNLFQSWQIFAGILHPSDMTRAYYFSVFGQTSQPREQQKKLLLVNRSTTVKEHFSGEEKNDLRACFAKYEAFDKPATNLSKTPHYIALNGHQTTSPLVQERYGTITHKYYAWIRATCEFYTYGSPDSCDALLCVYMTHKGYTFKFRDVRIAGKGFKANTWNKLELYYMTPELRTTQDSVTVSFRNNSKAVILIDDLGFEAFEPKEDKSVF